MENYNKKVIYMETELENGKIVEVPVTFEWGMEEYGRDADGKRGMLQNFKKFWFPDPDKDDEFNTLSKEEIIEAKDAIEFQAECLDPETIEDEVDFE